MISLALFSTLLLSASAVMPIMQPSDSSCKDFEGTFFKVKLQNGDFMSLTCEYLRAHGNEDGCTSTLEEVVKEFPGSYIPDERISLDMTAADVCPRVYKDMCRTCATVGNFGNSFCSINGFWNPEGYNYVAEVTEGVVSDFPSHGPGTGTVNFDGTVHWIWHNNNREHRGTFSDDCSTVTWENNKRWFRSTPPAFWENCHWQDASNQMKRWDMHVGTDVTYMGYGCWQGEILVGLEKSSQGIVDRIKCCSISGHSSISDCKMTEKEQVQSHEASCDANNHMVFNALYDTKDPRAQKDAFHEVMAGVCCEVECHEPWCEGNDWGVSDECKIIKFGQGKGPQNLECPSGYLMTKVHDNSHFAEAHGVQRIDEITCCKLDTIAAPSQSPSLSPSLSPSPSPTTMPTPAPTTGPSTSPTTAPSSHPTTSPTTAPTSVVECLVTCRAAHLTNKQFVECIEDCVPCFDYQRRNLEGRLLNESHKY